MLVFCDSSDETRGVESELSTPRGDAARNQDAGRLEVARTIAGEEPKEKGQEDGTDDGDQDGVEQPSGTRITQVLHDESSNDCAKDAYDDVADGSEAGTFHEFAGKEPGDQTYNNPPNNKHEKLLECFAWVKEQVARSCRESPFPVREGVVTLSRRESDADKRRREEAADDLVHFGWGGAAGAGVLDGGCGVFGVGTDGLFAR